MEMLTSSNIGLSYQINNTHFVLPNYKSEGYTCIDSTKEKRDQIQEEQKSMSYCLALKNKSYIVLASDSRSVTLNAKNVTFIEDNFPKILYLKKSDIVIVCGGKNRYDNIPITDFIKSVESSLYHKDLDTMIEYIASKIQEKMFPNDITNILIAKGLEAKYCDITKNNVVINTLQAVWRCGSSNNLFNQMYIKTENQKEMLTVDLDAFTLPDLIWFAKHIITTQMEYTYFTRNFSYIGGPIQILVLDKNGVIDSKTELL